jgi:hypothetical protein
MGKVRLPRRGRKELPPTARTGSILAQIHCRPYKTLHTPHFSDYPYKSRIAQKPLFRVDAMRLVFQQLVFSASAVLRELEQLAGGHGYNVLLTGSYALMC